MILAKPFFLILSANEDLPGEGGFLPGAPDFRSGDADDGLSIVESIDFNL